jgi:hypothetical protein
MSEWARTVRLGKRDANEPAIRRVVEVEFSGSFEPHSAKDGPDAFVGLAGITEPWEIKVSTAKLKPGQKRWSDGWKGRPSQVVRNEAQARKRLRMMRDEREREIAQAVEAERGSGGPRPLRHSRVGARGGGGGAVSEQGELKRGKTYVTEWARIQEACIAVADADAEDDGAYRRAQVRLMKTMKDLGWRKTERKLARRWISKQLPFPWMPREE